MTKPKLPVEKDVDLTLIDEPEDMIRLEIDYDYIDELAQSIHEIGLLQSILLARKGERFDLVAGHCRFLAHKKLGLLKIRSTIKDMTKAQIVIARATENLSRKNLTPLEEAKTYHDLIHKHGLSLQDVARKVGKSPALVKRRQDILRMAEPLQKAVHKKQISITVAEELWPISDMAILEYYLTFAIEGGCTATVARSWCKDWRDTKRRKESGNEGTGEMLSPFEPRPTYITCDLCSGPMELGKEVVLRCCPDCYGTIKKHM